MFYYRSVHETLSLCLEYYMNTTFQVWLFSDLCSLSYDLILINDTIVRQIVVVAGKNVKLTPVPVLEYITLHAKFGNQILSRTGDINYSCYHLNLFVYFLMVAIVCFYLYSQPF